MDDGNLSAFNFEHHNFSNPDWFLSVICQEQQVSSVKCWFHTATRITDMILALRNMVNMCINSKETENVY